MTDLLDALHKLAQIFDWGYWIWFSKQSPVLLYVLTLVGGLLAWSRWENK